MTIVPSSDEEREAVSNKTTFSVLIIIVCIPRWDYLFGIHTIYDRLRRLGGSKFYEFTYVWSRVFLGFFSAIYLFIYLLF